MSFIFWTVLIFVVIPFLVWVFGKVVDPNDKWFWRD